MARLSRHDLRYKGRTGLFGAVESLSCAKSHHGSSETKSCLLAQTEVSIFQVNTHGVIVSKKAITSGPDGSFIVFLKPGVYVLHLKSDSDAHHFTFATVGKGLLSSAWVYSYR